MAKLFRENDVIQISKSKNEHLDNKEFLVDRIDNDMETPHVILINTKDFTKTQVEIDADGRLGEKDDHTEYRFIARGDSERAQTFATKIREKATNHPSTIAIETSSTSLLDPPIHISDKDIRHKSDVAWQVIERYFRDNPQNLVAHHIDSVNHFYKVGIPQIFRENNPFRFWEPESEREILLYLGGKDADRIFYGKPVIFDENDEQSHYLFPNEARLRNMTYGVTIHYDIDVEMIYFEGERSHAASERVRKVHSTQLEKVLLGRFPIMLQSNLCVLSGLNSEVRFHAGECRNDCGGYFIVDGQEKVIVSQEIMAINTVIVQPGKHTFSYSADILSVSENSSKSRDITSVRLIAPNKQFSNNQVVVFVPNFKQPVPLFILMRALGIISDRDIIQTCLLDLDHARMASMVDLFIPSVHDAYKIFNQYNALEYLAQLTTNKTIDQVWDILSNHFLPHIGEQQFLQKAYYLGYMVCRLLRVFTNLDSPTDPDHLRNKRIQLSGEIMFNLFRESYLLQKEEIENLLEKEYWKQPHISDKTTFLSLIDHSNCALYFKERTVARKFRESFQRLGLLDRTSWYSFISQLREIKSLKVHQSTKSLSPCPIHLAQWGFIDPMNAPNGSIAMMSTVSIGFPKQTLIHWLAQSTEVKPIMECRPKELAYETKVFVNGEWVFMVRKPLPFLHACKLQRRNGVIPFSANFSFDIAVNEIHIYTDAGRLIRPIFYIDNGKLSYDRRIVHEQLNRGQLTWDQMVAGLSEKTDQQFSLKANRVDNKEFGDQDQILQSNQGIIDYIDVAEQETALIATTIEELRLNRHYTHMEIDASLILGVLGNLVVYPEHNPSRQNALSCFETKEAVSVYHSNHSMRMDPTARVLHYGQTPLIKSRYLEFINNEEQPYGVNTMVAIMSFTGYNTASSILVNQGSIDRGMFATTCFSSYESKEHTTSQFMNIRENQHIHQKKKGYSYEFLDNHGIIRSETKVHDKMILIGQAETSTSSQSMLYDISIKPNKGQHGIVDKTVVTLGEEGSKVAKVRIRDFRTLDVGDKLASRSGLKGVVGIVLPEDSMPFMQDGLRPDIIINPHEIPSHMTVGQIIESLFGMVCTTYGTYGDCTAFQVKGANYHVYGPLLTKAGFNHTGNHVLYNGLTGEQIQANIYMGPTYYMRSRHMTQDKVHSGPRSGPHLGERERDALCAHGLSYFLNESFMVRGDEYYMAICNKTGAISVYNSEINVFLSPFADGPLRFHTSPCGNLNLKTISRYGRSFSLLRIPRAFKLLIQELQVMNIQLRLVTDANVDQLMSMTFSNNISRLLQIPDPKDTNELKQIVDAYVKTITKNIHPPRKTDSHKSKPVVQDEEFIITDSMGEKERNEAPSEENQLLSQALAEQLSDDQTKLVEDLDELTPSLIIKKPEAQESNTQESNTQESNTQESNTQASNTQESKTISILEVPEEKKEEEEDKDNYNESNKNETNDNNDTNDTNGGDNVKKIISFSDDTKN